MKYSYKANIKSEIGRYDMSLRAMLLGYDSWFIGNYLRSMRFVHYYSSHNKSIFRLVGGINKLICRKIGRKIGFQFHEAQIGFGIKIFHWGNIIINRKAVIGDNFCVYPGVCIGRTTDDGVPKIGNNVTFFCNSGAYGGITIGNNVTVAANAVVTHDVPDNCIVAGVPAKIIKFKTIDNGNKS